MECLMNIKKMKEYISGESKRVNVLCRRWGDRDGTLHEREKELNELFNMLEMIEKGNEMSQRGWDLFAEYLWPVSAQRDWLRVKYPF